MNRDNIREMLANIEEAVTRKTLHHRPGTATKVIGDHLKQRGALVKRR
jgi:hypothetical protein